ncbi:hypothetical protein Val02_74230 [Virgisporangium aliadipatigenens]|uniref:histidine kinase n=1 Tax=Virgisporangium aliadipatigenens TaxID=741659 RepID=A0A8J3YTV3_9ACTN|nr:hypothetical protein Val02_74230 [Virgisporangium aliadipatigenens]
MGLLRHSDDAAAPVEPAPGLSQLPALLDGFRRAGPDASVRQAGTDTAHVRLAWDPDGLTVSVADDGPGARTPAASAAPERPAGYGLIGMGERASAVGGTVVTGTRPEGGFLVRARLPIQPMRDTTGPATDEAGTAR